MSGTLALGVLTQANRADAERVLFKEGESEVFTDGSVGAFLSWSYGDGFPQPAYGVAPDGNVIIVHNPAGGGWSLPSEALLLNDPSLPADQPVVGQGRVNMMRVRNGYVGTILGFGARSAITPTTKVVGYLQLWAFAESVGQRMNVRNDPDVRQGYARIEGPWGAVLAGRTHMLFSRAATEIEVAYGHRWGVGFPPSVESYGAAIAYTTPRIFGLELSAGLFDPTLPDTGGWFGTKYPRLEGELTFERTFGSTGKVVLFANGAIQEIYRSGYCPPPSAANPLPCSTPLAGFGYGGRFELGPMHIGVAGHRSVGIEPDYLPDVHLAAVDAAGSMRSLDGYYLQSQLVFGRFDVFAGASIARVFLTATDREPVPDPTDPTGTKQVIPQSVIRYQLGIHGGIVYQIARGLHVDADYYRAQAAWYQGEKQVIHVFNGGMIVNW